MFHLMSRQERVRAGLNGPDFTGGGPETGAATAVSGEVQRSNIWPERYKATRRPVILSFCANATLLQSGTTDGVVAATKLYLCLANLQDARATGKSRPGGAGWPATIEVREIARCIALTAKSLVGRKARLVTGCLSSCAAFEQQ